MAVSALALFCEDIREEQTGVNTLVGILPDNVRFTTLPSAFPKLGIYLRIRIPVTDAPPTMIAIRLRAPETADIELSTLDSALIQKAMREALDSGASHGGLISQATIVGFEVKKPVRINVIVSIDGQDTIAGTLNLSQVPSS
jgi:hypothetical protein